MEDTAPARGRIAAYRQALELYSEERLCRFVTSSSKDGLTLTFEIPNENSLSTNLLKDDPVYWKVDIEGQNAFSPIDASFLIPVYGKQQ